MNEMVLSNWSRHINMLYMIWLKAKKRVSVNLLAIK